MERLPRRPSSPRPAAPRDRGGPRAGRAGEPGDGRTGRPRVAGPGVARRALPGLAGAALALLAAAPAAHAVPTGDPVRIATGLKTPWELALAPGGRTFVVERNGDVRVLGADDALQPQPVLARSAVAARLPSGVGVSKLLGFALAPDFAGSGLAYLYVATSEDRDGGGPETGTNGIWRLRAQPDGSFAVVDRVFTGIGSDGNHDGGRMAFGPDGTLYVTTGDIHQPSRPQDPASLNGKILRFAVPATGELTAPADNPFVAQGGNARFVWSLGHRHPQGLAFDAAGRLWETEHGPTGEQHGAQYPGGNGKTGRDELNLIVRGGNYGWPLVSGPDTGAGLIAPAAVAPDSPSWAPGDVAVGADGSLYAPFLAGAELRRFDVRRGVVFAQGSHVQNLGRLRVAVPRGSELLFTQDGDSAGIYRLPLSPPTPGGSDAADGPSTTGPPISGGGAPSPAPPVATPPRPETAAAVRSHTRALARKVRDAARRLGARRLAAGRTVSVRAAGPSKGRTTIELRLRSSRGPLLARTRPRTTSSATQRYRVRLTATGRARLRSTTSRRLVVRVIHRPATGATTTYATATRIARLRR